MAVTISEYKIMLGKGIVRNAYEFTNDLRRADINRSNSNRQEASNDNTRRN